MINIKLTLEKATSNITFLIIAASIAILMTWRMLLNAQIFHLKSRDQNSENRDHNIYPITT